MKLSALIAPLLEAKADPAVILALVHAYEAEVEDGKEKARVRWRTWDQKRRSTNGSKRLPTVANDSKQLVRGDAHVEDKTLTSESTQKEESKKEPRTHGDVAAFRARLAPLVSAEVLEEFIKVRRKKRGALTGFAAGLFVADAETVALSPQAAATECVRSSWITVKPEYFQNRQRAGPQAVPSQADVFAMIGKRQRDEQSTGSDGSPRAAIPDLSLVRAG